MVYPRSSAPLSRPRCSGWPTTSSSCTVRGPEGARSTRVFDIVSRRRWYFAISLLVTIPGLIFILLTPLSGGRAGLRFSNDYTGGTIWEIHFKDGTPTTAEVRQVLASQDLADSTVAITQGPLGSYVRMRMAPIGLEAPAPSATPVPTLAPSPSATPSSSPTATPA